MASLVPFDRATIRYKLTEFKVRWLARIEQWKVENRTATESSHDQQFWGDLLDCFGINARGLYIYQRNAKRASTGNTGKIDMFMPGKVIGEAKSLGVSLDDAHKQALDYLLGGTIPNSQLPPYVLCSNFETLRITRLNRDYVGDTADWDVTFNLDEIDEHVEQLAFLADYETSAYREEEQASLEASRLMVELFRAMNGDEVDEAVGDEAPTNPEEEDERVMRTSVYLTRILFLLFGDDAGLWDTPHLFADFVRHETTSESLGPQLNELFRILNTPENKRSKRLPKTLAKFPYVNGALFAETLESEYFDYEMRQALIHASDFDWSKIDVSVFGSLFQLVKSKEARRGDGEHYTSKTNILKTIGPLFLDELRDQADKLVSSPATPIYKLEEFRDSLAELVFCDPACGAGNFLIMAYRELRKIETDLIVAIRQRRGETGMSLNIEWEQKLSIGQFYGFELNWWPAKIAETAMFLVDHQANKELANAVGRPPQRLPISITAHIHHGNALALDWSEVLPTSIGETFIFGNPPFRGDAREREQQADLERVWGTKTEKISRLDFVTGWHAKCLDFFESRSGRFAFVTTNSITQGDQVPRLFGPIFNAGWRIRFAHRTFVWDSEAPGKAAVHCVIVGFDRANEPHPRLWDYVQAKGDPIAVPVDQAINAYLVDGPNVLVEKSSRPLSPILGEGTRGSMPSDGGHLLIDSDEYKSIVTDPIAEKYVRPYLGARELLHGEKRWCLWLEDVDPRELIESTVLRERVSAVRDFRAASKAATTRSYPYHHLFRQITAQRTQYLGIPIHVSEARRYYPVLVLEAEVISSNANFTLADPDGLQFGLMSSSMFITWQKMIGGRIKSDLRFGSTLTWYTFPVPKLDEVTRRKIIGAGKKVLNARSLHPERSLAEHYNPLVMAPELVKAHDALDKEVDKAMGAPRKLTTERQRQELLFANYAKMTHSDRLVTELVK